VQEILHGSVVELRPRNPKVAGSRLNKFSLTIVINLNQIVFSPAFKFLLFYFDLVLNHENVKEII